MKIGYIVTLFPCWSETFILREIIEMAKQGETVRIFSLKEASEKLVHPDARPLLNDVVYPDWKQSLKGLIVNLFRNPIKMAYIITKILGTVWRTPAMSIKSLAMLPRTLGFLEVIKKEEIDHLHAHWATYPSTATWIYNVLEKKNYSFTAHAHDIWLEKPLLRDKVSRAKFVDVISEYNKRYLSAWTKAEPEKFKVIHCGINLNDFKYHEPLQNTVPQLLSVGRFVDIKGFPYLVDGCRILKDEGIQFKCKIVGNGPLRPKLENYIEHFHLEDVIELAQPLPQSKIYKEIQQSTLFVLPSIRTENGDQDGIPVVLMEAMASGTPVLSTMVSGIPELIQNHENGVLVEQKDSRELVNAIKETVFNRKKLNAYSQAGRRTIESDFNIKKTVTQLLAEIRR